MYTELKYEKANQADIVSNIQTFKYYEYEKGNQADVISTDNTCFRI